MDNRKSFDHIVFSYEPMFQLMQQKGITDLQLAKRIRVKVDAIRDIQLRSDTTTISMIKDICKELECSPGDLIEVQHVKIFPAADKEL